MPGLERNIDAVRAAVTAHCPDGNYFMASVERIACGGQNTFSLGSKSSTRVVDGERATPPLLHRARGRQREEIAIERIRRFRGGLLIASRTRRCRPSEGT
jgi:hypothetical protein